MNVEDTETQRKLAENGMTELINKNSMVTVERDEKEENYLIYGVNDVPPLHITIICALQHVLLSLSSQLMVSLLVAETVCASNNQLIKAQLLSSTLIMDGVTTIAMCLLGVRLPLFQGAKAAYVVPLLLVANNGGTFCSNLASETNDRPKFSNATDVFSEDHAVQNITDERILYNIQALQGSLIVAGLVHAFFGMTGLVGMLLRFIGPLTIVPSMLLLLIFVVKPTLVFLESNWPISISTVVISLTLCLYLAKHKMPIPIWTPSKGLRTIRYPLHQVFAVLISMCINWLLCGILTATGVFTDDPTSIGYKARTDAQSNIIGEYPWFSFSYPGQWGPFKFDGAALISFMIATFISILDSIGDYYACARVSRVPAPPAHAVNRGIVIEGLCTVISGMVGCGHATSTYGGNIGAIALTGVASRQVFVFVGLIYTLFGLFGKISAIFITIPYPVLGGAIVVMFGIFVGIVISNLEVTAMSSPRNISILGLSLFIGLVVPTWVAKVKTPVNTGMENFDSIVAMLLGNPNSIGTILAFVLDNTVPGTKEERGIAAWHVKKVDEDDFVLDHHFHYEGYEVYRPWLPRKLLSMPFIRYVPFLPYRKARCSGENGVKIHDGN